MKIPSVPYVLSMRQSSKQTLQRTMLYPEKEKDGVRRKQTPRPQRVPIPLTKTLLNMQTMLIGTPYPR